MSIVQQIYEPKFLVSNDKSLLLIQICTVVKNWNKKQYQYCLNPYQPYPYKIANHVKQQNIQNHNWFDAYSMNGLQIQMLDIYKVYKV
jgi:hypothetical protein